MVFLPKTDLGAQERCRQIVETEVLNAGYAIYSWRQVPIDVRLHRREGERHPPEIEQILIWNPRGVDDDTYERDLYVIRRRIERQAIAAQIPELYLCSLSCRSLIYKGMFLAENLTDFYPDLLDERFVSRFAIYHQRYSTNTFPTWRLAQPFRMLAHNGEINTLSGNVNWMKSHETRLSHPLLDPFMEDIKPVVQAGGSDTATLDNVFELLVRGGRDAPMAKAMLIPESLGNNATMPEAHRDLFLYCNAVMEPVGRPGGDLRDRRAVGDRGPRPQRPAARCATRDRRQHADRRLRDRHGEAGGGRIRRRAASARASASAWTFDGPLLRDGELKDLLAARKPFGEWSSRTTRIDGIVKAERDESRVTAARSCAAASSPSATRSRSWRRSCTRWWRRRARPSARWATTRRWRCCRASTAACTTISASPSAR
jgi:glutamate synthase (NADPH/NADH) large chain